MVGGAEGEVVVVVVVPFGRLVPLGREVVVVVVVSGSGFLQYRARTLLHSVFSWKRVGRSPRRIVPPRVLLSISGMWMTTGSGVTASNSTEAAFGMLQIFRANSMTAICMPKQIPRYGVLFLRAQLAALIIPSVPRLPNPPGTKTPSDLQR